MPHSAASTGTSQTGLHGVVIALPVLVSFAEDWVRQCLLGVSIGVGRLATPHRVNHTTTQSLLATPVCNLCPPSYNKWLFLSQFYFRFLSAKRCCPRSSTAAAVAAALPGSAVATNCFHSGEKLLLKPSPSYPQRELPAPSTHATMGARAEAGCPRSSGWVVPSLAEDAELLKFMKDER